MGRFPRWQLCLLLLIVAMIVGFARVEHLKRLPPAAESGAPDDDAADGINETVAGDPVGDFLADVIGDGSETSPSSPMPLIADLPVLPEAFWPDSPPRAPAMPTTLRRQGIKATPQSKIAGILLIN
jgi:hypothetical protein